jgi:hypothetical protein
MLAPRVSTSRSTRMTAPTRVDHSVLMAAGAALTTETQRSSYRLRL